MFYCNPRIRIVVPDVRCSFYCEVGLVGLGLVGLGFK